MTVDGTRRESRANTDEPGSTTPSAQAAGRLQQQRRDGPARAGDGVQLSDACLATFAVQAAENAPDIRPDVVERARRKLESGELGKDLFHLADKMIDSLLSR